MNSLSDQQIGGQRQVFGGGFLTPGFFAAAQQQPVQEPVSQQMQQLSVSQRDAIPLWKQEVTVHETVISDSMMDNLPPCCCNLGTKARYFCPDGGKSCKGPVYYCEENCMNKILHNHLPEKISVEVTKHERKWRNLMGDLSSVQAVAQEKYSPFNKVANVFEAIAHNHEITLNNNILKDINKLVNLSRYANSKYYGNSEEEEDEIVQRYIVELKLVELIGLDRIRTKIGMDLDSLRYLERIDEDRFYDVYKPVISICSTKGAFWTDLDEDSYKLSSRLKFRSLEDTITALGESQSKMDKDLAMLKKHIFGAKQEDE